MSRLAPDVKVANRIIDFIFKATGRNAIVCDSDGTIMAARIRSRIGGVHSAAQRMLREGLPYAKVTAAEEEASGGAIKAGVNLPVRYGGATIGSFGIAGDPELTEPIALIAAGLITKEIHEQELARQLLEHATHMDTTIARIVDRVEEANSGQAKVAQLMEEVVRLVGTSMADIDETKKVVDAIKSIARKTHMLAINAAIEATHAQAHGRAFSVVAREVRDLSKESEESTKTIASTQSHLQFSMGTVAAHSKALARNAQTQTQVTASISEMVAGLKAVSANLIQMASEHDAEAVTGSRV